MPNGGLGLKSRNVRSKAILRVPNKLEENLKTRDNLKVRLAYLHFSQKLESRYLNHPPPSKDDSMEVDPVPSYSKSLGAELMTSEHAWQ